MQVLISQVRPADVRYGIDLFLLHLYAIYRFQLALHCSLLLQEVENAVFACELLNSSSS